MNAINTIITKARPYASGLDSHYHTIKPVQICLSLVMLLSFVDIKKVCNVIHVKVHGMRVRSMRGSRKFCQRVSNSANVCFLFLVDDGSEDPNNTKSGPSSARQRNVIEMAFRWRDDNGPTLYAGLVAL